MSPDGGDNPIRAPIYSLERLEEHAQSLAAEHRLMRDSSRGRGMARRLRDNARALSAAYLAVIAAVRDDRAITPAAEWLADNYYVVDEQLRQIQEDLPSGFYRLLPKLGGGFLSGYPRVFALSWAFVAHTDSRFDPDSLAAFVDAYQRTQPLTIGELWALPITMRIVLVENLRRMTERVVAARHVREEADAFADGLLGLGGIGHRVETLEELKRRTAQRALPRPFAVQLVQRLREEPKFSEVIQWLEARLSQQGTPLDEAVTEEYQFQAAANVSVRNVITSMRLISAFDWADFFERVSLVDAVLRQSQVYAESDFTTRDRYRHAIEELAHRSDHSELEIARQVVAMTRGAEVVPLHSRDPGYFLISKGRDALERELKFRAPWRRAIFRAYIAAALLGYLGTIALVTLTALAVGSAAALQASPIAQVILWLIALIPASEFASSLLNAYVTATVPPRPLPKLELRDGIPQSLRTVVVVPTLFSSPQGVNEELERLEVRFLANSEGHLHFALLADFTDAPQQAMPGDDALLETALNGVRQLNERYGPAPNGGARFLVYCRNRCWSDGECRWMGWERKRGKLHEFNRLLRGATDTGFTALPGATLEVPPQVRFVITLDADTLLPRGAACRLIGAMAHPLNQPRFDPRTQRVVEGYAVLQPRVTMSLPTVRDGTLLQRVFSSHAGIDPYSSAASDVYQDLFGEGSYTGKGIYDVDAFETALAGRVPETTLLSHDLFEGLFARAGLLSDVELVEEYPAHYAVHASRQHRWARGDWQLLPWILSSKAPIPAIGRWKMTDNLRRSLFPVASVLALVAGWVVPGVSVVGWTLFIVGVMSFSALLPLLMALVPPRTGVSRRSYFLALTETAVLSAWQIGLTTALLTHQAWLMMDAVIRTLVRLVVTRRNLLEWRTAAQASSGADLALSAFYSQMYGGPLLGVAAFALVLTLRPTSWWIALPFALAWIASPAVARAISQPRGRATLEALSIAERATLRLIARRTWRFFERFVVAADNFLPPDNFQETPKPVIAHRTSPTNIGLALISTVSAHDFGWQGLLDTTDQLEATLETTLKLERFRGHLYNWYDTQNLRPLEPRYVSSVDSGNLAGHLIALAQACRELAARPLLGSQVFDGIGDAVQLARAASQLSDTRSRGSQTVGLRALESALEALEMGVQHRGLQQSGSPQIASALGAWAVRLETLRTQADTLVDIAHTISEEPTQLDQSELVSWAEAVRFTARSHARDLETLLPWVSSTSLELVDTLYEDALPSPLTVPEFSESLLTNTRLAPRDSLPQDGASASPSSGDPSAVFKQIQVNAVERANAASKALVQRLEDIASKAEAMFDEMGFGFLFDPTRKLFSIGYNVSQQRLDPSYYDLLASEARLMSFLAIAKGEVPTSHWFHLGRELTPVDRGTALVSWAGSMFEYLMPALVMNAPAGSLLAETQRHVVRRQIQYGAARGVPWGISESAYAARDLELTYQYMSFGVPGLGLKRGLAEDLVIAPYATALAAMIEPVAAVRNLERLEKLGASGIYGFYDALDYTAARVPEGTRFVLVRNFMVHHQGMALVALSNVLLDDRMVRRFHGDPRVQSAELLLQERTPRGAMVARPRGEEVAASNQSRDLVPPAERVFTTADTAVPQTHLLSNGRYTVMVTNSGSGFSRWNDLAVTRWREDATRDASGSYIYLRDVPRGAATSAPSSDAKPAGRVWSATPQPTELQPERFEARFSEGRAEFFRRDAGIETTLEIVVSPEDDAELRRVSLANLGSKPREIELTSYLEVVLATPAADSAHPAFSKLFVQTEFVPSLGALLATRRPRSSDETPVWAAHVVTVEGGTPGKGVVGNAQFETDRARFLGRGRDLRDPAAVGDGRLLSGTAGPVLDPIFSLRRLVHLEPGARARVTFTTLIAPSRESAAELADKYRDPASFERELTLAWTRAQVELHHLGLEVDEAHNFQRLAGRALYLDSSLRPPAHVLERNALPQSGLWKHGISGDLPIVLLRIDDPDDLEIVRQAVRAHGYWRTKRLAVDLVILNEQPTSYAQELQNTVLTMTRTEPSGPGGVFVLRADMLSTEERDQLRGVARVVLSNRQGSLAEQAQRSRGAGLPARSSFLFTRRSSPPIAIAPVSVREPLEFGNGLGGFGARGTEYVIRLTEGQWTPAPWVNVIANASLGFIASEAGSGYTWAGNSRENKLTPWSNDPVSDPPGEAIFVRDEDSAELFTPTPLPIREQSGEYIIRHGQGYTVFEREAHGLRLELTQFVPTDDAVKISRLTIQNTGNRVRRLSVTAYLEWVLGVSREASAINVLIERDAETGALLARNPWSAEFGTRIAFADLGGRQTAWTTNRTEFIGRNGSLRAPAGLEPGVRLSNRAEPGQEPCAVLQSSFELAPGASSEVVFTIGQAETREAAHALILRTRAANLETVLGGVKKQWDDALGAVQVRTPDRAMDLMLNRWLLYQTLSSRIWGRTGFYQAGGAYGFRDQLQDVMALTVARPDLAREQIVRAAHHQFLEGDVQHWWHPPSGRGVRTHISDDLIWLAYTLTHYLEVTNDHGVLDEIAPFIEGPPLPPEHEDSYFTPQISDQSGTVFEHAARALDRSSGMIGAHGLPLIGSGDWNDGLNRVGREGKGESVWLAWFLHTNLTAWAQLAEARGETARAARWRASASSLEVALETEAWDGDWYKRGFFDDGTPLGSAQNEECRIDAIAQSWAVISGAAPLERARRAMAALEQNLVRRDDGLVLLFTPPFDKLKRDPGYIKGYLPGVRENGGQYTHAAVWSVIGFAALGDGDKAAELFSLLNPINHAKTRAAVNRYKVEPYVVAADVYAEAPHVGRGGWTWYTGSGGWLYRAGIEWILGFKLRGNHLVIDPCIPTTWPRYEIDYKFHSARYEISIENPRRVSKGVTQLVLDGQEIADASSLTLVDDGAVHKVRVVLG